MNFCSHCGGHQLNWEIPPGDTRSRHVCPDCHTIFYQNPKIVAGCLAIWQDKVLLCKRAIEPRSGLWNLPAGYLENGETVEQGAMRELWEEAGAQLEHWHVHTLYNLPHVNQVYIHLMGQLKDGAYTVGDETLESQLFAPADIPWDELAFSSTEFALREYLKNPRAEKVHIGTYDHKS